MWNNDSNKEFYDKIPLNVHRYHVKQGGLAECEDLEVIKSYILNSRSILEIGAGYGRILSYLLKQKAFYEISAIERSTLYYDTLCKEFSSRVKLHNIALLDFKTTNKYDLILWMASGLSDFAKNEQLIALQYISNHLLADDGTLILDIFPYKTKPINTTNLEKQTYTFKTNGYILRGYLPTHKEVLEYGSQLSFKDIKHIPYKTATDRGRSLYVLSR